ncbi:MAG: GGDEF domain-containing protein [Chloroherpetonaceae bacterium]|nr:GGDEF domain-containing protein [Chloroherpetonaceae bacterium]
MQTLDSLSEELRRRIFTLILFIMVISSFVITCIHFLDSKHSHFIDFIVPPFGFIVSTFLLIRLLRDPNRIAATINHIALFSLSAIVIPIYFYTFQSLFFSSSSLLDLLPPISAGPFLLTTIIIVFLRPRSSLRRALGIWVITAFPIVIYFAFIPEEIFTPRGKDLFMTLGPFMAVNTCMVYYHSKMNVAVMRLQDERMRFKIASETDMLTGAFNRRAGEILLNELTALPQSRTGLIVADIDHFKRINDTYGHPAGDRVIQLFANCIQHSLRESDTLVRWGGEEFIIIVRDSNLKELQQLGERLRQQVLNCNVEDVGRFTASFGITLSSFPESPTILFQRADQALYKAKQNGRNRIEIMD